MGFVGSGLWQVRQKWGQGPLVWPGITAIPLNSQGQVWVGKRLDNGFWNMVGGYYELGDSAESCARREVKEETGLDTASLTMIGVITDPAITRFSYPNGDEVQSPSHVFVVHLAEGEPAPDDEHSEFKWISLEDADALFQRPEGFSAGYSSIALAMYANWLQTQQFQVK